MQDLVASSGEVSDRNQLNTSRPTKRIGEIVFAGKKALCGAIVCLGFFFVHSGLL